MFGLTLHFDKCMVITGPSFSNIIKILWHLTRCVRFSSSLRHIYPSEFTLSRVKCHKILIDLPSNLFAGITTLNYTIITLALVSYLCSSVVRALHRHRKGVGSIPAGGPIVDEFFSTVPGWFFDICTIQLQPKTHLPL